MLCPPLTAVLHGYCGRKSRSAVQGIGLFRIIPETKPLVLQTTMPPNKNSPRKKRQLRLTLCTKSLPRLRRGPSRSTCSAIVPSSARRRRDCRLPVPWCPFQDSAGAPALHAFLCTVGGHSKGMGLQKGPDFSIFQQTLSITKFRIQLGPEKGTSPWRLCTRTRQKRP